MKYEEYVKDVLKQIFVESVGKVAGKYKGYCRNIYDVLSEFDVKEYLIDERISSEMIEDVVSEMNADVFDDEHYKYSKAWGVITDIENEIYERCEKMNMKIDIFTEIEYDGFRAPAHVYFNIKHKNKKYIFKARFGLCFIDFDEVRDVIEEYYEHEYEVDEIEGVANGIEWVDVEGFVSIEEV